MLKNLKVRDPSKPEESPTTASGDNQQATGRAISPPTAAQGNTRNNTGITSTQTKDKTQQDECLNDVNLSN